MSTVCTVASPNNPSNTPSKTPISKVLTPKVATCLQQPPEPLTAPTSTQEQNSSLDWGGGASFVVAALWTVLDIFVQHQRPNHGVECSHIVPSIIFACDKNALQLPSTSASNGLAAVVHPVANSLVFVPAAVMIQWPTCRPTRWPLVLPPVGGEQREPQHQPRQRDLQSRPHWALGWDHGVLKPPD